MSKYPINFIDFDDFRTFGEIPRNSENQHLLRSQSSIDRSDSLVVYISHQWLRSSPSTEGWDGSPHPDDAQGHKFDLCVDGISKIKNTLAPKLSKCYIWIDFSCTPEDDKGRFRDSLEIIISLADCIFTPIHGTWSDKPRVSNVYEEYNAPSWNQGNFAYLNRGWCRLDMFYAANLPMEGDTNKLGKLKAGLHFHASQGRRPHFLFGTTELVNNRSAFIVPPLQNSYLEDYSPDKGQVVFPADAQKLHEIMVKVAPTIRSLQVGYVGDENIRGEFDGYGKLVFENGEVYEGDWVDGCRTGVGVLRLSTGDCYSGEWLNDRFHGRGSLTTADGAEYKDCMWVNDMRNGPGTCTTSEGDVYTGNWKSNERSGHGTCVFANKDVYEGEWVEDQPVEATGMRSAPGTYRDLLDFDDFRARRAMPSYADVKDVLRNVNIDRSQSLIIYVSHQWLRLYSNAEGWDGSPHPDDAQGHMFDLCVDGISKIKNTLAPALSKCYIWIDFSCLPEDNHGHFRDSLDMIIGLADCMFTPVYGEWPRAAKVTNAYEEYASPSWQNCLRRAWFRLEMFYAANLRVDRVEEKMSKFKAGLKFHASRSRRPHFLFGTGDLQPIIVPPLQNYCLYKYNPVDGDVGTPGERERIANIVHEMRAKMTHLTLTVGYDGEKDEMGQADGRGRMQYRNGDIYEGNWARWKRSGAGKLRYATGEVYKGRFEEDEFHGRGVFSSADGDEYSGQWVMGRKCGAGSQLYSSGDRYDGDWSADERSGHGVCVFAAGGSYSGMWQNDLMHGKGVLSVDGKFKDGVWERGQNIQPSDLNIYLIDFKDFKKSKEIPRYYENSPLLKPFDSIDREKSLIVYISHRWLRSHANSEGYDGRHPDDVQGHKFDLCVDGISKIKTALAPDLEHCYIWMEFCCKFEFSRDYLENIIQFSDLMFTPIYGSWSNKKTVKNFYKEYDAAEWLKYVSRGWCRLDMFYTANIPVEIIKSKVNKFKAGLKFQASRGRRPHFLYGTTELQNKRLPIALPPMQNSYFTDMDPREGEVTYIADMTRIRHVVETYGSRMITVLPGYSGPCNGKGEPHGKGTMDYFYGDTYSGYFVDGKRCGDGVMCYSNGDVYDGEMKDDLKDGKGELVSADGDVYAGEWLADMRNGRGRCTYASGDVYVGQWANGERSGQGECTFANGDVYEGHWLHDNMDGKGQMTCADGSTRGGPWIDGFSCTDYNRVSSEGNTSLMLAVKANKIDAIIFYIGEKDLDVNVQDRERGRTAMMLAVKDNNATVVELLLRVPTLDLTIKDNLNMSALCLAASLGYINIGVLLLSKVNPVSALYTSRTQAAGLYGILMSLKMIEMRKLEMIGELLSPGQLKCYGSDNEVHKIDNISDALKRYDTCTLPKLLHFFYTLARKGGTELQIKAGSNDVYKIIECSLQVNNVCHAYFLNACLNIAVDLSKPEIFGNEVIGAAVDYAWRSYGYTYHLKLTAAYIMLLALVTVDNYTYNSWVVSSNSSLSNANEFIEAAILLFNSWFVFLELCQVHYAIDHGLLKYYLGDIFNSIDWASFSLLYSGILLRMTHREESYLSSSLMSVSTVMLWLNFLYFLRPYRAVFYVFVKLIFSVATDIKEVIAILLIVIYGFSQSFYLLSYADKSLLFSDPIHGILTAYKAILTSFSFEDIEQSSNPALGVFLLSVYIALTAILILNLLIAVMNNSYNAIQSTQRAEWNRERCKVMLSQVRFTKVATHQYTTCIMREDDRIQNSNRPDALESRLKSYVDAANEDNKTANETAIAVLKIENRALRESVLEMKLSLHSKLDALLALSTKSPTSS